MIRTHCRGCKSQIEVADFLAGLTIICKSCRARIDIPRQKLGEVGQLGDAVGSCRKGDVPGKYDSKPFFAESHFRVLRLHAKGGLGLVSIAYDEQLNREVALKEIQDHRAHESENRSRFLVEAEITGRLEHPGIVPVYALGRHADGRPFYAMRLIKGDSLKDVIDQLSQVCNHDFGASEHVPELRQLLARFITVCLTIQYAHDRGILHRDIKPGNIMLGKYGETLVVDWGVAKAIGRAEVRQSQGSSDEPTLHPTSADGGAKTIAGTALGTPQYMSPEQAAGRVDKLGPASDVYGLGATLYCLLTGQPPVDDHDPRSILDRVKRGDILRPRLLKPTIDPALEAICLKAMALKANQRYASPQALADDLERWLADKPVCVWRESWAKRTRRWMTRHRTLITGISAACLVGLVSLWIMVLLLRSKNADLVRVNEAEKQATARAIVKEKEASRLNIDLAAANAAKKKALYRALLGQTAALRTAREPGYRTLAWQCLHEAWALKLPDARSREIRDEALACLGDCVGLDPITNLKVTEASVPAVPEAFQESVKDRKAAAAPRQLHFASGLGRVVYLHDEDGVELTNVTSPVGLVRMLRFSPNGQILVAACEEGVAIFSVPSLTLRTFFRGDVVHSVAIHPWGHLLATKSQANRIELWSLPSNRMIAAYSPTSDVKRVAFSADAQFLLAMSGPVVRSAWPVVHSPEKRHLAGHEGGVTGIAFSPNGRSLASVSKDRVLRIWNSESGSLKHVCRSHAGSLQTLDFSPDGKILASAGTYEIRLWESESGKLLGRLDNPNETGGIWRIRFSPNGRLLAVACGKSVTLYTINKDMSDSLELKRFARMESTNQERVLDVVLHPREDKGAFITIHQLYDFKLSEVAAIRPVLATENGGFIYQQLNVDATGKFVTFLGKDSAISLFDWEKGVAFRTSHETSFRSPAVVSANFRTVALRKPGNRIVLRDLHSDDEGIALPSEESNIWAMDLARDGKRLAAGFAEGGIVIWNLEKVRERLAEFGISEPLLECSVLE